MGFLLESMQCTGAAGRGWRHWRRRWQRRRLQQTSSSSLRMLAARKALHAKLSASFTIAWLISPSGRALAAPARAPARAACGRLLWGARARCAAPPRHFPWVGQGLKQTRRAFESSAPATSLPGWHISALQTRTGALSPPHSRASPTSPRPLVIVNWLFLLPCRPARPRISVLHSPPDCWPPCQPPVAAERCVLSGWWIRHQRAARKPAFSPKRRRSLQSALRSPSWPLSRCGPLPGHPQVCCQP